MPPGDGTVYPFVTYSIFITFNNYCIIEIFFTIKTINIFKKIRSGYIQLLCYFILSTEKKNQVDPLFGTDCKLLLHKFAERFETFYYFKITSSGVYKKCCVLFSKPKF